MRHVVVALLLALIGGVPARADRPAQRGRLVGPDGQGLADREVRIYVGHERFAGGRTDAEGYFAIDVAPLGTEVIVRLVVGDRPYAPACNPDLALGGNWASPPLPHDWGTLRVPRLPVLAGRVVDANGRPVAGVGVYAEISHHFEPDTLTDAEGRFELDMHIGLQRLQLEGTDFDFPALHLVEGQRRSSLELVLDPARLAQVGDNEVAREVRLERIGGDPAWGPPWAQTHTSMWPSRVVPGDYRVVQLESSAFMGPGTHPLRSWFVTLRPGTSLLEPPPDAAVAVPLRLDLDGVPQTSPEEPSLKGWSHPLEPPPLDESAFRRWPIHELADANNWRYKSRLLALTRHDAADDDDDDDDADDADTELDPGTTRHTLIAHLPGPGAWGLTLTVAGTDLSIPVNVDRQPVDHRSRWSPAGEATMQLVPPAQERLAYPIQYLVPLHAVLIDEAGVVRWARPLERYERLEVRGLPAGRYRLRWGYDGFHPREAALELRDRRTSAVELEPF